MKVYYFNITVLRNRKIFDQQVKTLDNERAEKVEGLRVTADKLRCVGAGILIHFVREQYGIDSDVAVDKFGKPYFVNSDIKFNISHSGMFVIMAVSDYNLGIDIQKIKEDKHRIAEKSFLASECEYINEIEDEKVMQQRFCEVWTLKEAYLKNIGIGLRKPLNSFEIQLGGDAPSIKGKIDYHFVQFKINDLYMVAICTDTKDTEFSIDEVVLQ